jgi:hypothetical protein
MERGGERNERVKSVLVSINAPTQAGQDRTHKQGRNKGRERGIN